MKRIAILLALLLSVGMLACEELVEEPTLTPEITARPTPIAVEETPTPGLPAFTAAECEFLDAFRQQTGQVGEAMSELASLLGQADLLSETWRLNMAAQLVTIQLVADDAHTLKPPSSLAAIHNHWLLIAGLFTDMVDSMVEGIDELDVAKIEVANELMVRGAEETRNLTSLIEDFNASRSGVCP